MEEDRANDEFEMDDVTAERIIGLNTLIEELIQDASGLSKDLTEGIGAMGGAAAIIYTIAIIEGVFLLANLWRGPLFIASVFFLALAPLLFFGTRMLLQFIELRGKYARIYEIRKEIEM
jgi:hypothetical protein